MGFESNCLYIIMEVEMLRKYEFWCKWGFLWVNWNNCNGVKCNEEWDWVLLGFKVFGFDLEEIYFNLMLVILL